MTDPGQWWSQQHQIDIPELLPETIGTDHLAFFTAAVTVIWPFSSSYHRLAILLADPDFRHRQDHGQIKVNFVGHAANEILRVNAGSGDQLHISLIGARWSEAVQETILTPGQSVKWELEFVNRLKLQILKFGEKERLDVDIDQAHDLPLPERSRLSGISTSSTPLSRQPFFTPRRSVLVDDDDYAIPIPRPAGRSLPSPPDDDPFLVGSVSRSRKRLKLWRTSGRWQVASPTVSGDEEAPEPSSDGEDKVDESSNVMKLENGTDHVKVSGVASALDDRLEPTNGLDQHLAPTQIRRSSSPDSASDWPLQQPITGSQAVAGPFNVEEATAHAQVLGPRSPRKEAHLADKTQYQIDQESLLLLARDALGSAAMQLDSFSSVAEPFDVTQYDNALIDPLLLQDQHTNDVFSATSAYIDAPVLITVEDIRDAGVEVMGDAAPADFVDPEEYEIDAQPVDDSDEEDRYPGGERPEDYPDLQAGEEDVGLLQADEWPAPEPIPRSQDRSDDSLFGEEQEEAEVEAEGEDEDEDEDEEEDEDESSDESDGDEEDEDDGDGDGDDMEDQEQYDDQSPSRRMPTSRSCEPVVIDLLSSDDEAEAGQPSANRPLYSHHSSDGASDDPEGSREENLEHESGDENLEHQLEDEAASSDASGEPESQEQANASSPKDDEELVLDPALAEEAHGMEAAAAAFLYPNRLHDPAGQTDTIQYPTLPVASDLGESQVLSQPDVYADQLIPIQTETGDSRMADDQAPSRESNPLPAVGETQVRPYPSMPESVVHPPSPPPELSPSHSETAVAVAKDRPQSSLAVYDHINPLPTPDDTQRRGDNSELPQFEISEFNISQDTFREELPKPSILTDTPLMPEQQTIAMSQSPKTVGFSEGWTVSLAHTVGPPPLATQSEEPEGNSQEAPAASDRATFGSSSSTSSDPYVTRSPISDIAAETVDSPITQPTDHTVSPVVDIEDELDDEGSHRVDSDNASSISSELQGDGLEDPSISQPTGFPFTVPNLQTEHASFATLNQLKAHYNKTVDILAIVESVSEPQQSTKGPKDWFLKLNITDPSLFPSISSSADEQKASAKTPATDAASPPSTRSLRSRKPAPEADPTSAVKNLHISPPPSPSTTSPLPSSSHPTIPLALFRPYRRALPLSVAPGDAILLHNIRVKTEKRAVGLISTEESAWALWKGDPLPAGSAAATGAPGQIVGMVTRRGAANAHAAASRSESVSGKGKGTGNGKMKVRGWVVDGPPVEWGREEREVLRGLRRWFAGGWGEVSSSAR